MKSLFTLILFVLFLKGYSQNDSKSYKGECNDLIIKSFSHVICIKDKYTVFDWVEEFDSITIEIYNRNGNKLSKSTNPNILLSNLFKNESTEEKFPFGSYFMMINSYIEKETKSYCCWFQYMKTSCVCR